MVVVLLDCDDGRLFLRCTLPPPSLEEDVVVVVVVAVLVAVDATTSSRLSVVDDWLLRLLRLFRDDGNVSRVYG